MAMKGVACALMAPSVGVATPFVEAASGNRPRAASCVAAEDVDVSAAGVAAAASVMGLADEADMPATASFKACAKGSVALADAGMKVASPAGAATPLAVANAASAAGLACPASVAEEAGWVAPSPSNF